MKKTITLILLILFVSNNLCSQESCIYQSFIIKIENSVNVPTSSFNSTNNTITLTHSEQYITDIFSKYIIYKFEEAFPDTTSEVLKKYYRIYCASKDLINELNIEVPDDIFFFETIYEGESIDNTITNFFSTEKVYSLKEYITTSDGTPCTFDCSLNPVPEDLNITIKIFYDTIKEQLILENAETTSCGNSFKFQFKKPMNSLENDMIIWEAISNNPCFDSSVSDICELESLFFETLLGNFNLITNEESFRINAMNAIFGENVFSFEQKSLSLNDSELKKSIIITPNPIKDNITLIAVSENIVISKIAVYNYSGKEVIKSENAFNSIDVSLLSSGIYFLQVITTSGQIINKKVVKE